MPKKICKSFPANHMNAPTPTAEATRNSLASAILSLPSSDNDFWKQIKEPTQFTCIADDEDADLATRRGAVLLPEPSRVRLPFPPKHGCLLQIPRCAETPALLNKPLIANGHTQIRDGDTKHPSRSSTIQDPGRKQTINQHPQTRTPRDHDQTDAAQARSIRTVRGQIEDEGDALNAKKLEEMGVLEEDERNGSIWSFGSTWTLLF